MRIFDSHAHYDDEAFAADRTFLLEQDLPQKGVWRVINCGASIDGSRQSVQLSHTYGYIYAAVGVHPEEAAHLPDDWVEQIRQLAKTQKWWLSAKLALITTMKTPVRGSSRKTCLSGSCN